MRASAKSPDEYLARIPEPHRSALQRLRRLIRAAAPSSTETMCYQMPAFRQRTTLVCYAAFKNHCSLFIMSPRIMKEHAAELEGYDVIPAGVRFAPDEPLPAKLVRALVKARLAEDAAGAQTRTRRQKLPGPLPPRS